MDVKAAELFPDARLQAFKDVAIGSIFWMTYHNKPTYGIKCVPVHDLRHQASALLFTGPEWTMQFCGLPEATLVLAFANSWRIQPDLTKLILSGNTETDSGALFFSQNGARHISCTLRDPGGFQESGFVSLEEFSLSPYVEHHRQPVFTEWEILLCDQKEITPPLKVFKHSASAST